MEGVLLVTESLPSPSVSGDRVARERRVRGLRKACNLRNSSRWKSFRKSTSRADERRSSFLCEQNIMVLRFWNHDVFLRPQTVLEAMLIALEDR